MNAALTQHPLSAAFPPMSTEDFATLRADIEANGQRDYIITHDGMVLDGWHRYQCVIGLGREPKLETLDSRVDPRAFVLSRNLHRRHLTASQRGVAVVECAKWHPPYRGKKVEPGSTLSTNAELAKVAKVSEKTITDAKAVVKAGRTAEVMEKGKSAKSIARPAKKSVKPSRATAPPAAPDAPEHQEMQDVYQDTLANNERLTRENDALAATDQGAQIRKMDKELGALRGRIDGLMRESKEAQKQARFYQKKCDDLRKLLGIEKASGLFAAVEALKVAAEEPKAAPVEGQSLLQMAGHAYRQLNATDCAMFDNSTAHLRAGG